MKTLQASKLQLAIGLPYNTDSSLKCYVHATLISDRDSSNNTGNKTITLINDANAGNTGTSVYTFKINVDESDNFRLHDSQGSVITDNDKNDIKNIKFTFTNVPVEGTTITTPQGTPSALSVYEASQNGTVIGTGIVSNAVRNTVKYELKVFYDEASYNQNDGRDAERVFTFHVTYDWKDSNDTTVRP